MPNALRPFSVLVQRRPAIAWAAVVVGLVLAWWVVLESPRDDQRVPLLIGAVVVSALLVLLGAIVHALAAQAGTAEREIARMATTDLLTGALNRRSFMAAAGQEFTRATRYERPLAVLSIDVDVFKDLNDVHGHAAGDTVLQGVTAAWQSLLRATDRVGRMGGEEFAILLPETDAARARDLAERVRSACEGLAFPFLAHGRSVTVSVGVAAVQTGDSSIDHALARADRALLAAKRHGRNRVEAAPVDGSAR